MISLEYETPIQPQLRPGEQLLWVGRPRQGFLVRSWDSVFIVVGLLWLACAMRWGWDTGWWLAWRLGLMGYWHPPNLFEGFITLGGVALFTYWFAADVRRRAAMWYALTDRRVLFVMTTSNGASVNGIEHHEVKDVAIVREFPGGSGTIRFRRKSVDPYAGYTTVMTANTAPDVPTFEAIPAVKEVFELAEQTRDEAVKKKFALMRSGFDADIGAGFR